MSGDIPSVQTPPANNAGSATSSPSSTASPALDLGQAVIVSMPKEVLDVANSAKQAGRILAEVIAQQGQNATLKTPDGAFIIRTDSSLSIGQVVMLRLDPQQLAAQALRLSPVDDVAIRAPYQVPLTQTLSPQTAINDPVDSLPQPYWRGQLAAVAIPDDPMELLHVLQDIYQPGMPLEPGRLPAPAGLPPAISEGVAKFFALTQLLREMNMLPAQLKSEFLFAGLPPANAQDLLGAGPTKLAQGLQGLQNVLTPAAKQATEQAGNWLKGKLPPGMLGQLDQLKTSLQKNLSGGMQPTPGEATPGVMSFAFPPGTSLLQVWQNALQGQGADNGQAPFLLLNMLGLQRPGQNGAGAQSGLSQLMAQFKDLQGQNANATIMPTLVLPGNGQKNPVLFSPFGLLFSNTATVLGGREPLLPGTLIFWQPMTNPQPAAMGQSLQPLPFWPAGKTMPASVFEWPDLTDLFAHKDADAATNATWQATIQNMLPNMLQPDRLGGNILLLLHALNRNAVASWIGDKTADSLRDEGKQPLLARLVSDFATSAGRVIDPAQPDLQRFVLPLVLHDQMAKMVWQVRRDYPEGGDKDTDPHQRRKNTRTHFTVDVPTATLGDMHLQGTVWQQQLDLNIQTAKPLDDIMQNGIRERFQTALSITGMSGQIVFAS